MAKKIKRFLKISDQIDFKKKYNIKEGVALIKKIATAKFDETIEAHIRLGIDTRHSDQQIRTTVILPHGSGRVNKIIVFAKGLKEKEAIEAGADYVGLDDLIDKIEKGWMDFNVVVSTPDVMSSVSKIGKILGPKGLMPNPKVGTVTQDISKIIKEIKSGKVEIRLDKAGIIHIGFAKVSFDNNKIEDNFNVLLKKIISVKPSSIKGIYIKSITIKSTMSPGVKIDHLI